ncbi:hypothetical protein J6590_033641 [Homalodisca vitripennis]|nr:hypothetical protein J6590_033641 [Homalodisca vitripennis]
MNCLFHWHIHTTELDLIELISEVTGCLLIMLGFWVMLDPSKFHLLLLMTTENEAHYFVVALAYTFFLVGCGMFGLVFMGCCTIQTKASLIAAYLTITVLLECIELAAVLTVISCRSSMLVGLQSRLIENLMVNYGHQNNDNVNTHGNNVFTQSLDYTQYMLHCCGVTGAHDYNTSRWFNESTLSKEPRNVPITCCLRTELEVHIKLWCRPLEGEGVGLEQLMSRSQVSWA